MSKYLYDECEYAIRYNKCSECNDFYQCSLTDYLEEHDTKVRADAIDEVIKKLAENEDTILTDKQYYELVQLKEKKNEN